MTHPLFASADPKPFRPVAVDLGPGPSVAEMVRRSAGADSDAGLVCLHGQWAGGGGIVASRPVVTREFEAHADAIDAVRTPPTAGSVVDDEFVGGGWFGWLAYDGPSYLAFYDHLLRRDRDGRWRFEALWTPERQDALDERRRELTRLLRSKGARLSSAVGTFAGADMTRHLTAVEDAIELIRAGEIFQVNVCTRLSASFDGQPAALFADAAATLQPAFGAFVDGVGRALAGFSPELFLRRRGRRITTSPIKGTWPANDPDAAAALAASTKDAAENVMIVDLMRNDFGRVCEVGSVAAATLLQLEQHPGVWHLVSTVAGVLRTDVDDAELLHATFPPGSVTGAPKQRAMAAIASLEGQPRGAYTGAVGFVSPCWGAEWAVTIRSFEIAHGRIELGVGGGVTADSVPMLEWRECLHKASPLLRALGAGLAGDAAADTASASPTQLAAGLLETIACRDGHPVRLADHLSRLERSSRELYRRGLPTDIAALVNTTALEAGTGWSAVHIRLDPHGGIDLTRTTAQTVEAATPLRSVTRHGGLWRHRWAYSVRSDGGVGELDQDGVEPLFIASDGTVLETGYGNVFLLLADGTLITPPLRDDLLPGVTRRALLDYARDEARPVQIRGFDRTEMTANTAFWTNSIGGAVPIASVDGVLLPAEVEPIAAFAQYLVDARR
ncbi:MAG TPA: aminodeoxychorismate synthase component I [Micromonosporaceae bacterium]|nr:aminodeoxychorismate synthase component I [Micromonosporaceae bacterium]